MNRSGISQPLIWVILVNNPLWRQMEPVFHQHQRLYRNPPDFLWEWPKADGEIKTSTWQPLPFVLFNFLLISNEVKKFISFLPYFLPPFFSFFFSLFTSSVNISCLYTRTWGSSDEPRLALAFRVLQSGREYMHIKCCRNS